MSESEFTSFCLTFYIYFEQQAKIKKKKMVKIVQHYQDV